jgi:hypothetical protein
MTPLQINTKAQIKTITGRQDARLGGCRFNQGSTPPGDSTTLKLILGPNKLTITRLA